MLKFAEGIRYFVIFGLLKGELKTGRNITGRSKTNKL